MSLVKYNSRHLRDLCARLGLLVTALVIFELAINIWTLGQPFRNPITFVLSLITWGVGTGALCAAFLRTISRRVAWFILLSLALTLPIYYALHQMNYTPLVASHTDNEMIARYAVEAMKRGQNPYAWNFSDILRVYRDRGIFYTPFLDGAYQNRVTHPALPTLLYYGLDMFGIAEIRAIMVAAHVGLLVLLFLNTPGALRPVVLLPLFVVSDYRDLSLTGDQNLIWVILMIGVVMAWRRPNWRAVLYGLACAFRQQPWFLAPFLVMHLWHEGGITRERVRRVVHFIFISAGIFLLVNLPFILWGPAEWLSGVFEPLYAAFNYFSQALGTLTQYNLIALPREYYTFLQVLTYLLLLILYWIYPCHVGNAFWIFPGLFFWFYYRGLGSYWIYWLPVVLFVLANGTNLNFPFRLPARPVPWTQAHTENAFRILVVAAVLFVGSSFLAVRTLIAQGSLIEVRYVLPLEIHFPNAINRMHVTVTNHSASALTPRFSVHPAPGLQAMPWHIESGPEQLAPGQSGQYSISALERFAYGARIEYTSQLIVTDANGDYRLRAVLDIPPQTDFMKPDKIANPDFRYWSSNNYTPAEWQLNVTGESDVEPLLSEVDGRTALTITLRAGAEPGRLAIGRLSQMITFPDSFVLWVYPTQAAADPANNPYGIEFDDGVHRLWILFGDANTQGVISGNNQRYVVVQSPLRVWSRHTLDLQQFYRQFGWPLPVFSDRIEQPIRFSARQGRLSLIAGTTGRNQTRWVFGPIEQIADPVPVKDVLDNPDTYYVRIGNNYQAQRNYDLAERSYLRALVFNPQNPDAYFGLGTAQLALEKFESAREAFSEAIRLGYFNLAQAYTGLGWAEYRQHNDAVALQYFEEALQHFGQQSSRTSASAADTYFGAGQAALREGSCAIASLYFQQAKAIIPALEANSEQLRHCSEIF